MARRFKRSTSKQYGWACAAGTITHTAHDAVIETVIIAGDADIEVRAVGGTHANLKRIVGDVVWYPYNLESQTSLDNPPSSVVALYWCLVLKDNDDTSPVDPSSATDLSEEAILGHGILPWMIQRYANQPSAGNNTSHMAGEMKQHIDVRSNRRIKSDNDVVLCTILRGSVPVASQDTQVRLSLRSLVVFP